MDKTTTTKCVIVTGVAGGMGRETAMYLRDVGYSVIGLDLKPVKIEGVECVRIDLTDSKAIGRLATKLRKRDISLYAIVHQAGMYDLDSLVEVDEERFRRIFEVNLYSVYLLNRAMIGLMREGSRVIVTSSELAPLMPLPFTGLYAITKTAIERYAFSLRHELNLLGIHVSILRPGATDTGLLGDSQTALDKFVGKTTLYDTNAVRFKAIVDSVENKNIHPSRIARLVAKALSAKRPRYVYNINRNILLRILNILPHRLQVWIITKILKK